MIEIIRVRIGASPFSKLRTVGLWTITKDGQPSLLQPQASKRKPFPHQVYHVSPTASAIIVSDVPRHSQPDIRTGSRFPIASDNGHAHMVNGIAIGHGLESMLTSGIAGRIISFTLARVRG